MLIRKTFTILAVCALSTPYFSPSQVMAQSVKDSTFSQQGYNRKFLVGTYILSTFFNGNFVGRRVITLTEDGNFFAIDSNQGGTQFSPNRFTDGQGVWKFNKSGEITATTLNFNFPAPGSTASITTARADYRFRFNRTTKRVEGTAEIRTFDLTKNPLTENVPVGEGEPFRFSFTGQRVTVSD